MNRQKSLFVKMILCGILATLVLSLPRQSTFAQQKPLLRLSEPVDGVVSDLEVYIPERMHERDTSGLAIALIRDCEVVWTEGFGATNSDDGLPVVYDVAQRALGGEAYWRYFNDARDRAAKMEFKKTAHSSYVRI